MSDDLTRIGGADQGGALVVSTFRGPFGARRLQLATEEPGSGTFAYVALDEPGAAQLAGVLTLWLINRSGQPLAPLAQTLALALATARPELVRYPDDDGEEAAEVWHQPARTSDGCPVEGCNAVAGHGGPHTAPIPTPYRVPEAGKGWMCTMCTMAAEDRAEAGPGVHITRRCEHEGACSQRWTADPRSVRCDCPLRGPSGRPAPSGFHRLTMAGCDCGVQDCQKWRADFPGDLAAPEALAAWEARVAAERERRGRA